MSEDNGLRDRVREALVASIGGDAYDCSRVWEAWSARTMSSSDFAPVLDRVDEIVDDVMAAISGVDQGSGPSSRTGS